MLRMVHTGFPLQGGHSRISSKTGQKGCFNPQWKILGLGAHYILNHSNPSPIPTPILRFHSFSINTLPHQTMSSTDLVMQQPWGLIILYFEFPELCGYKREDILLVCNRKSFSRTKNLELQVYLFFFFKLSSNTLEGTSPSILLFIN